MATIGGRILEAMAEKGLNQRDVEKAAGLKKGHLSVILERQGGMRPDTGAKVATALGVSLAWLLTGEGALSDKAPAKPRPKPLGSPMAPLPFAQLIDRVFDGHRHKPSDAAAVTAFFGGGLTQGSPRDAEALVRALLDAAAYLRAAGAERITSQALMEALALRVVELESAPPTSERLPEGVSGERPPSQPGPRQASGM